MCVGKVSPVSFCVSRQPPQTSTSVCTAMGWYNIGIDSTVVMSLRLLGGMEKNEHWTHKKQRTERKKRKFEEGKEGKVLKPSDDAVYLRRDIMEAFKRSDEKMENYSRKANEKMESYS